MENRRLTAYCVLSSPGVNTVTSSLDYALAVATTTTPRTTIGQIVFVWNGVPREIEPAPERCTRGTESSADNVAFVFPKTELGKRLWEIRAEIVSSGARLLGWEDIERELADRRGGAQRTGSA